MDMWAARRRWGPEPVPPPAQELSIATIADAANEPRIAACRCLLEAAGRFAYVLGRAIERECAISYAMFEVLLLLGRTDGAASMREIAQQCVLTTGGVTRLVDRMQERGLVLRTVDSEDRRIHLVALTEAGEATFVRAARIHAANVERYVLDVLPPAQRETLLEAVAALSRSALTLLPRMP